MRTGNLLELVINKVTKASVMSEKGQRQELQPACCARSTANCDRGKSVAAGHGEMKKERSFP